jgi:hypothetical protein
MNGNPQPNTHDPESRASRQADGEMSELARRHDPSQAAKKPTASITQAAVDAAAHRRGVVWVRSSELMSQVTARAAGRGIDFHAELAHRARRAPVQTVATSRRAISERARRLPPVTAFGRRGQAPVGATRAGIGLR